MNESLIFAIMKQKERYDELCRLCASYDAVKMDIFGQEGRNRQLVDKIQTCLPFKIAEEDRLPKCLCYRCMYNLENFYDFRTACINAVALLEKYLLNDDERKNEAEKKESYSELRMELLKEKESMPNLIPEAPVVNPNAALGTPPRIKALESEIRDVSPVIIDEPDQYDAVLEPVAGDLDDVEDQYEMDMETNPSDFLEMTSMVPGEDNDQLGVTSLRNRQRDVEIFQHHNEQHEVYVCSLCSKAFSSKGHLSLHARIHVGAGDVIGEKVITDDHTSYKRPYQCDLCNKSYSTAKHRWGHVSTTHRGHPAVTCSYCSRIYSTRTNLEEHVKSKHNNISKTTENLSLQRETVYQCRTCSKTFSNAVEQNKHIKNCSGEQVYVRDSNQKWYCEVCPQNFDNNDDLKQHEKAHCAEKPYLCILCEKDFTLKSSLTRHILSSHGVDPIPIIESGQCFKRSIDNEIITTIKQEEEVKKEALVSFQDAEADETSYDNIQGNLELETVFVCEVCTRDFNDRASLWLHIRATHKEYAAFACGICLKICQDNEQLLNHVNMYHGGSKLLVSEQRRYSCTICGRQHDSRKKLITHVSIHNIEPSYDPASFVQLNANYYSDNFNSTEANDLIMDCESEEVDKVECYICNKSFPNEDHLIRHQRNAHKAEQLSQHSSDNGSNQTTNGNRAQYHLFFVCELCGSSHPSKWERWLHVSSMHSEEASIRCEKPECAKIFATKSLKNEHAQHHLLQGISPNTCEICGKLWGSRVDYWKHVMGVHSDTVPLICGVCLKVFPDVVQLSGHVKNKHWPLTTGDFSCDICGRPYSNKSKMSRHRKIHGLDSQDPSYLNSTGHLNESLASEAERSLKLDDDPSQVLGDLSCELCGDIKFTCIEDLANHRRMTHSLFPCDLCNKCYGRTSHLWKHVNRVHKGHKDVTCRFCLKTSASKEHLAAHISKIHKYEPGVKSDTRESSYRQKSVTQTEDENTLHFCQKCNKSFHKRYLLRRHMKGCQNYRKDAGALLTRCRACERIFKDRASLQKHLENHHSSYECHLCKETITSKLGIMTHNRIHHMNHPDLTCDLEHCKKLFRTKQDLESHKKEHKYHNSPNVCDFCGDTVENKLKLKMHILSLHRNEIGVSCGVCLIPMKDPKDLKKHVEDVHASILSKPNTCQVCGKKYASKWKAFDHTKKCHGKVFRTCKQCLAVFTSDEELRNHYEQVHNIPKDHLDALQYRLEVGSKTANDSYDALEVVVKEEPDELGFEFEQVEDDNNELKRRRKTNDTFDCEMCPEIFLNQHTLSSHYKNVHSIDPSRMFKKLKLETITEKKKTRERENYECRNCGKQFCTKTLYLSHISVCNRKSHTQTSSSVLETRLKSSSQIKNEESDSVNTETNLNIPDFNLFEDINLQLSGQKPVPSLMPLLNKKSGKYSRKDSRKVYDETTNTECTCEVCGKPWPAKKHLWQHLIRFHRSEAAVTCGVCLKLCTSYSNLSDHLKSTHPAVLSSAGNNFTCKICGRYHNARSKLYLHMSIHINCNTNFMCQKCHRTFESAEKLEEHAATCAIGKQIYEEHDIDIDKVKQEEIKEENPNGEYESEDDNSQNNADSSSDKSNDSNSDSSSSSSDEDDDDEDGEGDAASKNSGNASSSDSKDSSNSVQGIDSTNLKTGILDESESLSFGEVSEISDDESFSRKKQIEEYSIIEKESVLMNYSDDEGPPLLSPMMPSVMKQSGESNDPKKDVKKLMTTVDTMKNYVDHEAEDVEKSEDTDLSSEDEEDIETDEHSEDDNIRERHIIGNRNSITENNSHLNNGIMGEEIEENQLQDEHSNIQNAISQQVLEMDESDLRNLNGTVLMLANDADGNHILVERNMADLENDVQDMTEYVFHDDNGFNLEDYESIVQASQEEEEAEEEKEEDDDDDDDDDVDEEQNEQIYPNISEMRLKENIEQLNEKATEGSAYVGETSDDVNNEQNGIRQFEISEAIVNESEQLSLDAPS